MKLSELFKYVGLIFSLIGALFILAGIIGYLSPNFLNVKNFSWFFWAANTFILFAITGFVAYIALRDKA